MNHPTKYHIVAEFNGEVYKGNTTSIKEFIQKMKPETLVTEIYLTITRITRRKRYTTERKLNLMQGKKMFASDEMMEVFISNLILA